MNDTLLALIVTALAFAPFVTLKLFSVGVACLSRKVGRPDVINEYWQNEYWQYAE
jgi:hypothetical protein